MLQKKQQPHGMKTRGEVRLLFQEEVAGKNDLETSLGTQM